MNKHNEIIAEIDKIKAKNTIQMQDVQTLAFCYGALQALNLRTTRQQKESVKEELIDIFPALTSYQQEHSEHNLRKLCLEIQEFCISVYATLKNDEEKNIYFDMVKSLQK